MARMVQKNGVCRTSGEAHCHADEENEIKRLAFVNECIQVVSEQSGRGPGLKETFEDVRER